MITLAETEAKMSALARNLDRAVDEVFTTMLGMQCGPSSDAWTGEEGAQRSAISAVIGLAGALSGSLVLDSSGLAARSMAGQMTGIQPEEVDAVVRDAIGEVANMVAGAWKGYDPELSSGCLLSTPTVVAGASYELFGQRAPMRIERSYRGEAMRFRVTIFCEWPG